MFLRKILKNKKTLLFRLTILYVGIFTLSSLLVFLLFYYKIYAVTMEGMDQELLKEFEEYSAIMEEGGIEDIKVAIAEGFETEESEDEFYRLITFNGEILVTTDTSSWGIIDTKSTLEKLQNGESDHVFKTLTIPGHKYKARMLSAVISPNAVLQIGETLEEAENYLQIFRNWFLLLLIISVTISALAGWLLAKRALLDMEDVTQTAAEISNGAYHRRVQVKDRFEEIKRLGGTFNKMLDRIQSLLNLMKEVNDNIAHDLRSPLARIRGIAEINLINEKTIDDYRNMAASIIEECDSLIEIINTMMDITEIESGINKPETEELDLVKLIIDAIEIFKPLADTKKINIKVNLTDKLIFIGDRKKLQRMVSNLLDNAIKYTPEGGTVSITASADEQIIHIVFEDTGIGISETDIPNIFERFYRCDMSRAQGGHGLGLSLARAFAETMNGSISVKSALKKGSKFTVNFPQQHILKFNTPSYSNRSFT